MVHGASLIEGKPSPSESRQRELADELRAKVQNKLIFFFFSLFHIHKEDYFFSFLMIFYFLFLFCFEVREI